MGERETVAPVVYTSSGGSSVNRAHQFATPGFDPIKGVILRQRAYSYGVKKNQNLNVIVLQL